MQCAPHAIVKSSLPLDINTGARNITELVNGWIPRSQRLGKRNLDGPYEGVPEHLDAPLRLWVRRRFEVMHDGSEVATNLAVRLRLVLDLRRWSPVQAIINQSADPDDLLDLIEAVLQVSTK